VEILEDALDGRVWTSPEKWFGGGGRQAVGCQDFELVETEPNQWDAITDAFHGAEPAEVRPLGELQLFATAPKFLGAGEHDEETPPLVLVLSCAGVYCLAGASCVGACFGRASSRHVAPRTFVTQYCQESFVGSPMVLIISHVSCLREAGHQRSFR
jgi:hypothetical protein